MDNFYTSPHLFQALKTKNIYAYGTVHSNRKGLPKDLKPDKNMARGEEDSRYSDGLYCIKWLDSKAVLMLSTIDPPNDVATAKRWQKGQADKVSVPCPQIICRYNCGMHGIDIMDQLTKIYGFHQKSPAKYYMRPFWLSGARHGNACIIQEKLTAPRRDGTLCPKTLLEFWRAVAQMLLTSCKAWTSSVAKRTASVWLVTSFNKVIMMNKPWRCRWCYVKEKTDCKTCMKCETYDFFLCIVKGQSCFNEFHSLKQ